MTPPRPPADRLPVSVSAGAADAWGGPDRFARLVRSHWTTIGTFDPDGYPLRNANRQMSQAKAAYLDGTGVVLPDGRLLRPSRIDLMDDDRGTRPHG